VNSDPGPVGEEAGYHDTGHPIAGLTVDAGEKCGAVKNGGVTLRCTEPRGHDDPRDGTPATWHKAIYTDHREITYVGARHVIHSEESVTWEPVDHVREATRHLFAGRRGDE